MPNDTPSKADKIKSFPFLEEHPGFYDKAAFKTAFAQLLSLPEIDYDKLPSPVVLTRMAVAVMAISHDEWQPLATRDLSTDFKKVRPFYDHVNKGLMDRSKLRVKL